MPNSSGSVAFRMILRSAAGVYNGFTLAALTLSGKALNGRIASMAFLCFKGAESPPGSVRGASLDDAFPAGTARVWRPGRRVRAHKNKTGPER
jgi:hypothetical protein